MIAEAGVIIRALSFLSGANTYYKCTPGMTSFRFLYGINTMQAAYLALICNFVYNRGEFMICFLF